jgi:hypothetical protein
MRRNASVLFIIFLGLFTACTSTAPPPPPPPGVAVVPEFEAMWKLLNQRQLIPLESAQSADDRTSILTHFQLFQQADSPLKDSAEMHRNGCIYVSYTPAKGPVWYDPEFANDAEKTAEIAAGAPNLYPNGTHPFAALKGENVNHDNWKSPADAFRNGRGPAPRWFTICVRPGVDPAHWTSHEVRQIPAGTLGRFLLNAGAYCEWKESFISGPPEWTTVLPVDSNGDNGQKKYFPEAPLSQVVNGIPNHYVSWSELARLAQDDPNRYSDIVTFRGNPNEDVYETRRVPWITSQLEGIATNSFLSGGDPRPDHATPPGQPILGDQGWLTDYWLGLHNPHQISGSHGDGSHGLTVVNSLADDWIIFVEHDIQYNFMLSWSPDASKHIDSNDPSLGQGNLDDEHRSNTENEIEQWMMPVGFRPAAGDRVAMTGRWVVDCGHFDYHAEIHPYETVVSTHTQTGRTDAIGNIETVSSVVATSDWNGEQVDIDLWPPPRPTAAATLHWMREPFPPTPTAPNGLGIASGISLVSQQTLPSDGANHLHLTLTLGPHETPGPLRTESRNNVDPDTSRRFAATFHLWWS